MLFDLRGRGRRRTVQVIYLGLALLMGGGLVLFGIGSSSNGGLFDAFSGNGGGGSATASIDKQVNAELAKTRANPKDAAAWAQLAIVRFQRASVGGIAQDGTYTAGGKNRLRLAGAAWERHLALDPKQPDVRTAKFMVQAYDTAALNEPAKGMRAMQIITADQKPPNYNLFAQLAQLAYRAHDLRTAQLAGDRAISLAPKDQRKALRSALDTLKTQATTPQTGQATTPTG